MPKAASAHTHEIWGKRWGKRLGNAKNRGESCEWPLSESGLINSINYAQVHYGNTRQTAPVHRIRPAHILRRMQFAGKSSCSIAKQQHSVDRHWE